MYTVAGDSPLKVVWVRRVAIAYGNGGYPSLRVAASLDVALECALLT